ncbi:MAG: oxidoreductase, partial [Brevundimonas sp.]
MTTDPVRLWSALGVLGLWLLLLAWTVWRARRKAAPVGPLGDDVVLIAHASQTGFGEALAQMTAQALRDGGVAVRLIAFTHLDAETLKAARRALLIVATTGEGDAPDSAAGFVRRVMKDAPDLSHLSYGLLALGDREYAQFCGFGRGVDHWLRAAGAAPLFDPVEVDNGDPGAVRHWQHSVGQALGAAAGPDWTPPAYEVWRLTERTLANRGSPGGEA